MLLLVVEKREAVEPDHAVRNPTLAKSLADSFGHTDDDLVQLLARFKSKL